LGSQQTDVSVLERPPSLLF